MVVVTVIYPGLTGCPATIVHKFLLFRSQQYDIKLLTDFAPPIQKNTLCLIPVTELAFSHKPQSVIAHLPGFGATTRDDFQGVLVASSMLILLDMFLKSLITML